MAAMTKDIDAYISKAQPFAQPILKHFRALVQKTCPLAEEKLKWGMPHFDYKGQMMCHMASFKEHVAIGFWKAPLMQDPILMENARSEKAMGHFGKITSLKDLPSDKQITAWIKEAMALNDQGIKLKKSPTAKPDAKELEVPAILLKAIHANKDARDVWEAATYSFRKEYATWIAEAKTEATKQKRLQDAIAWISEGRSRHWKYEK